MGIFLNPGYENFKMTIQSQIYVDKTEMIGYVNSLINTDQRYVAVSRPRRFGKTTAVNMLCAYYDKSVDSRKLFDGLFISKISERKNPENPKKSDDKFKNLDWDIYLNKFNVIRIDMAKYIRKSSSVENFVEIVNDAVSREIVQNYSDVNFFDIEDLRLCLENVYQSTNEKFIIIIDEWDAILRKFKDDVKAYVTYLDFLRDLLKDEPYLALVYMTGILPIKKYGEHSALNMFTEYSMISPMQLAEYVGFTEKEVKEICCEYHLNFKEIKAWYDGYLVYGNIPLAERKVKNESEVPCYLYSPVSVINAALTGRIQNYWNETETADALKEYIKRNYAGLKEDVAILMSGKKLHIDISTYQNDMTTFQSKDDIFTLLIHLGYLGYDSVNRCTFIPNKEVNEVFRQTTREDEWGYIFKALSDSQKLLEATWNGNSEEVARFIEEAHMRAGNQTYNSENALSYAVRLAYFNAEEYYTLIPEMQAGKGYADLVYIPSPKYPDKPAMLIELKWNKDAQTAIKQIHRQKYPESLQKYKGNLILVGINYDSEVNHNDINFKHHSCSIEKA
ncbi:PD-(D/E)XK nuclease superfamily protein [Lachnospiraceae bacterium KH1T2]|nr:PD-(D/E)XK nuclease superfamily protein [Lachnospiraceae bacterium KH1T2]